MPLRYFGQQLVLFRTESGEAVLLDAHCPHLGAHLGHGGTVEGEAIRCPFHSWRFDAKTGQVDDIPYKTSPGLPDVRARCWQVEEVSGLVIAWFSEHGRAPSWRMPEQEHWAEDGWLGYFTCQWNVRVHVQDLAENIPDTTHFVSVHHLPEYPQARATADGHIYRQVMGDDSYALRHEVYGLGLSWLNVDAPRRRHTDRRAVRRPSAAVPHPRAGRGRAAEAGPLDPANDREEHVARRRDLDAQGLPRAPSAGRGRRSDRCDAQVGQTILRAGLSSRCL
jgi:phenylpropionate dioxygenase-like ring-hydroxylating dioxygenase large terminal subunit